MGSPATLKVKESQLDFKDGNVVADDEMKNLFSTSVKLCKLAALLSMGLYLK